MSSTIRPSTPRCGWLTAWPKPLAPPPLAQPVLPRSTPSCPAAAGNTGGGDWFAQKLAGIWRPFVQSLGRYWIGERGHAGWDRPAPPDSIAAFVTWLCTPAASNVNGRDFFVGGDEVAMLSQPQFVSTLFHEGGWTLEALDRCAPSMTGGLTDPFAVPNPFDNDD